MLEQLTSPNAYILYAIVQAVTYLLLIRLVDLYEREPLVVVALFFVWGATGAFAIASVGDAAARTTLGEDFDAAFGAAVAVPPVEELAKGLALIAGFAASRRLAPLVGWREFEGVTDGIVFGAAVGLGFAFAEDLSYLFKHSIDGGFVAYRQRVDLFGGTMLGHAIYTGTFGAALGLAGWLRTRAAALAVAATGFALAVLMHACQNGLVQLMMVSKYGLSTYLRFDEQRRGTFDLARGRPLAAELTQRMDETRATASWIVERLGDGFFVGFFVAIAIWLTYQRQVIHEELEEEVSAGLLATRERALLTNVWGRSVRYWGMLLRGDLTRWYWDRRRDRELVRLALLKRRARRSDTSADARSVALCRERLARLRRTMQPAGGVPR